MECPVMIFFYLYLIIMGSSPIIEAPRIQKVISVTIYKKCSNVEIAFYIMAKTPFIQLQNISNTTIS